MTIGASGSTADATADDLQMHSNDHAGISILTPNNKIGALYFGDPEHSIAGGIRYNHSTDALELLSNDGSVEATLSAAGLRLLHKIAIDMTGANDLVITEQSANVVRIGSSGAATGILIDLATGNVSFTGVVTFTGGADTSSAAWLALAGGTVIGNIIRSTKGVHPYFNSSSMTGGRIYIQAIGADPTSQPGDIVYEY